MKDCTVYKMKIFFWYMFLKYYSEIMILFNILSIKDLQNFKICYFPASYIITKDEFVP